MHPILFKIGPLNIYSYGAFVALGFGIAAYLIYRRASEFGLDKNSVLDLLILILIGGITGGRILYVGLNLSYYLSEPLEIFMLSKGGLVWYGGFIFGLIIFIWYTRKKGMNFWTVADLVAPYIALAQGVGRIGCFLNGCCYGVNNHPTQIYSSAALIVIYFILRSRQNFRHFTGEIFLGYCILYSIKRFLMEFLRADNIKVYLNLTMSQYVSVLVFAAGLGIFIYRIIKWKKGFLNSR